MRFRLCPSPYELCMICVGHFKYIIAKLIWALNYRPSSILRIPIPHPSTQSAHIVRPGREVGGGPHGQHWVMAEEECVQCCVHIDPPRATINTGSPWRKHPAADHPACPLRSLRWSAIACVHTITVCPHAKSASLSQWAMVWSRGMQCLRGLGEGEGIEGGGLYRLPHTAQWYCFPPVCGLYREGGGASSV